MSETSQQNLSGVAETLLIPLYIRAMESQRPDALIKDERAEALVRQMDQDFWQSKLTKIEDFNAIPSFMQVAIILRSQEFDLYVRDFLVRHPDAVVVHIGCGLDSRFERVDNGRIEWYDLDLPHVIELRRELIGGEEERYHLLACSVLNSAWLDTVSAHRQRPFLFLAEGVLMYFDEAQVKSLVLTLRERFPGAELAVDAFSPFFSWANNLRVILTKVGARSYWTLKHGKDLERWSGPSTSLRAGDIRLLDTRYPFQARRRRGSEAWKGYLVSFLAKGIGVFRYQL
jgi:methyltransferase (TIGR00027 family)